MYLFSPEWSETRRINFLVQEEVNTVLERFELIALRLETQRDANWANGRHNIDKALVCRLDVPDITM